MALWSVLATSNTALILAYEQVHSLTLQIKISIGKKCKKSEKWKQNLISFPIDTEKLHLLKKTVLIIFNLQEDKDM